MSTPTLSRPNSLTPVHRTPRTAMQPGGPVEQPSQLLEYWIVIRANFGWICLLALVGAGLGWLISALQPSMYQARTLLDIRSLNENFLNKEGSSTVSPTGDLLPESYIQTEIKILTSDRLRKEALKRLTLPPQPGNTEEHSSSFLRSWIGKVDGESVPYKALVADAGSRIKVRAVGNTRMVEILCDARDSQLAASVCNGLASTYMKYNLDSRYKSTKETGDWLQSQLETVRSRLSKAENDEKDLRGAAPASDSGADDNLAQEKLHQIQAQLSTTEAERMARESDYETSRNRPASELPLAVDSGSIRELRTHLGDLQRQLAEMSATMTPEHYKVRELQQEIAETQRQIEREHSDVINRLKANYDLASSEQSKLQAAYARQSAQVAQQGSKSVQYNMAHRDVESERRLYETLLQKVDEVGLATAMRTSTISVVDPAVPPGAPYSPKTLTSIAVGLFIGACIGLAFSFIRLRSDRSLHGPGEASYHLQLRELGVIPSVENRPFRGLLGRGRPMMAKPVMQSAAETTLDASPVVDESTFQGKLPVRSTAVAEAFFATMNSLLFTIGNTNSRVIVMTSPDAGDGKTTVATNLAIALAQIGRRVVIVDADMRKPRLHQVFDVDPQGGLADLLDNNESIEGGPISDLVSETQLPNLFILPTAVASEGTVAKLHSSRLQGLLDRLRREFDVVIVDSPPMLHISDARVLGSRADGVVLVFRARKTTIEDALAAHDCLSQDGTKILGTILNDWNPRKAVKYGPYSAYFRATA